MRKLGLALPLLLGLFGPAQAQSPVGPPNQILCNQTALFTGSAALTQIVAAINNARIFICGWHITSTSATSTTFQLQQGTGTNCGTGTTPVTPALNVTLSAPSADHVDYAQVQTGQSAELCVNAPATVTGMVWFNQF